MIKNSARRLAFVVTLGVSTVAALGVAHAQSTTPTGKVSPNGITGTDPVPKGCVTQPPPTTSAATASPASTAAQALLVFLGLA